MDGKIVECVPNISEGRNARTVAECVEAVSSVPDVRVLNFTSDRDHNRSVITFAGSPDGVVEAAVRLCKKAAELMRERYIGNVNAVRNPLEIEFDNTYSVIHEPQILVDTYLKIQIKPPEEQIKTEAFNTIVKKKIVSVTSKIIYVLRRLYKTGSCLMDGLFDGMTNRSERVATFLAILELTKSGRIRLNEDNTVIKFSRNQPENECTGDS